jgi:hypothetical protein
MLHPDPAGVPVGEDSAVDLYTCVGRQLGVGNRADAEQ